MSVPRGKTLTHPEQPIAATWVHNCETDNPYADEC